MIGLKVKRIRFGVPLVADVIKTHASDTAGYWAILGDVSRMGEVGQRGLLTPTDIGT